MNNKIFIAVIVVIVLIGAVLIVKRSTMRLNPTSSQTEISNDIVTGNIDDELDQMEQDIDKNNVTDFSDTQLSNTTLGL